MKKSSDKILIISLIAVISLMDIFLKPDVIPCMIIALLTSVAAFCLGLSNIRLGKYTIPLPSSKSLMVNTVGFQGVFSEKVCKKNKLFQKNNIILLLVANVVFLCFTLNNRLYFINIFLLSYVVWTVITPFLDRFKNLIGFSVAAVFLAAYIVPLYNIKFPLLPFVFYPFFAVGFGLRNLKPKASKRTPLLISANALFSVGILLVVVYKARVSMAAEGLKFLQIPKPGPVTAVYQPFLAVFLIWFFLSVCLLSWYVLKSYIDKTTDKEGFEKYFDDILRYAFNFIVFFMIAGVLMFICEYILRGSIIETLKMIMDPPAMFNLLCLCTAYLILMAFMGRGLATLLLCLIMGLLALANFIKIRYFNEPFYPWDMYLISDALRVAKEYVNFTLIYTLIALFLAGVTSVFIFIKPVRRLFKPRLILWIFPLAVAMLLINGALINSPSKLTTLKIQKSWYIGKTEILSNGIFVQNYFYIKDYNKYVFNEPDGYSKEKMEEIKKYLTEKAVPPAEGDVKPNIVLIMDESYWDPTKLNGVTISKDIMKDFDKYRKGEIVSPAIGGGTANVEFEALTGLSTYFMGPGVLAYNVYFRRDTPSIVSTLKENGYNTIAMHPYKPDMYNRDKVYKYFQFDKFISFGSFDPKTDLKGPYVSDDKVVDKILDLLGEGGSPKFIFVVTMQNHDPYTQKYKKLDVDVKSDKLDEKETSILSTYSQGINDGSEALDKLITTLQKSKTPTLVYFFGDHLPRLGTLQGMLDIYSRLSPETDKSKKDLRNYSTPFASWSNFMNTRNFETPVSPSHIALEILKDSGVKYPSYFNMLQRLEKSYPYLQKTISKDVDMENQYIKDYRLIQYDLLFGKQYLWDRKK